MRKKKSSKKKTVERHFSMRCIQRLGYVPKEKDIIRDIQDGKLIFLERQSCRVTRWLWTDPVHGIECILPYDRDRKQIITVLFKDLEDNEKENFKIEKENKFIRDIP